MQAFFKSWTEDPKSLAVNGTCIGIILVSYFLLPDPFRQPLFQAGLFGFSGAITNWLAIFMLFERIPGLYGSGIIPLKFESFKSSIHHMMMGQFFTQENIAKFLDRKSTSHMHLEGIIEHLNYDQIFNGFIEVVAQSKLGGLLGMFGGTKALDPLREPFAETLKSKLFDLVERPDFQDQIGQIMKQNLPADWQQKIGDIVQHRLDELTPQMVKEIVQNMIRSHLGWLVVWGGVFGFLIGLISSFIPK